MSAWLYPLSETAGRTFDLADGARIRVNYNNYSSLIRSRRLNEDVHWRVWRNFRQIEIGDEIYLYMGSNNHGIIGYALVRTKSGNKQGRWEIQPAFDYDKCLTLIESPIRAETVRDWYRPEPSARARMLITVEPLDSFVPQLKRLVPW